jgi:Ni,Fe-hydrogenase III small subunit/NAD-dependent dihydropyrimidine dehydrogenase PreA subunit
MIAWLLRGLRRGSVTARYPKQPEAPLAGMRSRIAVLDNGPADPALAELCPTGAIHVDGGAVRVDRGCCILCGLCVERVPNRFAFEPDHETASRTRRGLWVNPGALISCGDPRPTLREQAPALRRSVHIRHVDAGSDGSEEWEIAALTNPYYDVQRLGFYFTAAPRHADILLVTGVVTDAMRTPLLRTWDVMPEPKVVVAVGTDACSGGLAEHSIGATGVDAVLPVDVYVPGSPPTPFAILHGLLLAVGLIADVEVA